jgi:ATP-dependent DNA helicase RecQ
MADLVMVYRALCGHYSIAIGHGVGETYHLDFRAFLQKYHLDAVHTYHCLEGLERDGWVSLSDSVMHPATVSIQADPEVLYTYQSQNPAQDELLKVLLRNYEGLFLAPVRIRESDIARILSVKENIVVEGLTSLARDSVIAYVPATEMPRITFLRERVEDRNLTFDTELIRKLRDQALTRAERVEQYIIGNTCRQQYLVSYFGEKESEPCGTCDVCRAGKRSISFDAVLLHIPREGIPLKELVNSFNATDQKEVQEILSLLETDELIRFEQDLVLLSK